MRTACYFVSRQGFGKLVSYAVNLNIASNFEPASRELKEGRKYVIELLDGELIT